LSAEIASWSLALIGLFNIIGAFMCGWLGGIVSKKKTLAIVYLLRGLIIAAFISLPASPAMALFFGAAMGLYGLVFLSHQIGSFAGAWLGGIWYDVFGNYEAMWWLNAAAGFFAFAVNWAIREPKPAAVPA